MASHVGTPDVNYVSHPVSRGVQTIATISLTFSGITPVAHSLQLSRSCEANPHGKLHSVERRAQAGRMVATVVQPSDFLNCLARKVWSSI